MLKKQNNPFIHEKIQILDAEKYNHSTRAVQELIIGSPRKPRKSKCRKKKRIVSPMRKLKYLTMRSTTI
jgi:hypothetical protein